jgi:hypothetical protein
MEILFQWHFRNSHWSSFDSERSLVLTNYHYLRKIPAHSWQCKRNLQMPAFQQMTRYRRNQLRTSYNKDLFSFQPSLIVKNPPFCQTSWKCEEYVRSRQKLTNCCNRVCPPVVENRVVSWLCMVVCNSPLLHLRKSLGHIMVDIP